MQIAQSQLELTAFLFPLVQEIDFNLLVVRGLEDFLALHELEKRGVLLRGGLVGAHGLGASVLYGVLHVGLGFVRVSVLQLRKIFLRV